MGLGSRMHIIQLQSMGQHGIEHGPVRNRPFPFQRLSPQSHPLCPVLGIQSQESLFHFFHQGVAHRPHGRTDQIQGPVDGSLPDFRRQLIPGKAGRKFGQPPQRCCQHLVIHIMFLSFL